MPLAKKTAINQKFNKLNESTCDFYERTHMQAEFYENPILKVSSEKKTHIMLHFR